MKFLRICSFLPGLMATGCIQSHHQPPEVVYYTPAPSVVPAPTVVYTPTPTSERPEPRVYAAPSPPPPAVAGADVAVAESVSSLLKDDPNLASGTENVLVTIEKGVVTLRGTVPAEHYKDEIVERVRKLPGVRRVEDKLGVEGER